jgi:hypothetical protein
LTLFGLREGSGLVRNLTVFKEQRARIVELYAAAGCEDSEEFWDAIENACFSFGKELWPPYIPKGRSNRLRQESAYTQKVASEFQYHNHFNK